MNTQAYPRHNPARQSGMLLLEAIIALAIFAIGALAMIAMQARSIATQSDAQYRIEAANLAQQMLGQIELNVNRTSPATLQASLASFVHRPTTAVGNDPVSRCTFNDAASAQADVLAWLTAIQTTPATRLPGSTASMQQIQVNIGTFNQVIITLCWQAPNDLAPRRHTIMSYIN